MFTGIIEARTRVVVMSRQKKGAAITVEKPRAFGALKPGCSIAVNGVCLTVVRSDTKHIYFQVVAETLHRSGLGHLTRGESVNLERALSAKGRLEGHFVLGHVDGLGVIKAIRRQGQGVDIKIAYPKALKAYVLEKGSMAIDGVSLTLGRLGAGCFWVHLIPHTLKTTGWGEAKTGQTVNLEADILLKFLHRLMIS